MTKKSRLRRFRVEVRSWGNYVEQIAELKRVLAKKPRTLQIEIVGTGEISADSALRFRAALMERSSRTRILTNAQSTVQGGTALLWLLGDIRTIRGDARLYFRRTTLSEDDEVRVNGEGASEEPAYRDSYSMVDADEGDYARVLQIINEYLPVKEMAGRLIGAPVLRQFGLIENDEMDSYLATVFSKCPETAEGPSNATNQQWVQRRDKARARQIRR